LKNIEGQSNTPILSTYRFHLLISGYLAIICFTSSKYDLSKLKTATLPHYGVKIKRKLNNSSADFSAAHREWSKATFS